MQHRWRMQKFYERDYQEFWFRYQSL